MGERTGYPSIDKPWLKYYSEEAINAKLPECTVYRNIYEHNREHLDDTALEYYGHKTSYGRLFDETERCAKALKAAGVRLGDRVTLCTAGVPEAVYLVLACSKVGAIANFLNPLFTTEQMTDRINDTEAELLFVLDRMYPYIAEAIDKTCIKRVIVIPAAGSLPAVIRALAALKEKPDAKLKAVMRQEKFCYWREFISGGERRGGACSSRGLRHAPDVSGGASPSPTEENDFTEVPYEKDRPVVMVYSSGTTGASKGIVLTNDGINATIAQEITAGLVNSRQKRFLSIVPIWFSTGVSLSILAPLGLGAAVYLEPVFNKNIFSHDILKYRPEYLVGATSLWLYAASNLCFSGKDLSHIECPMTGGEQMLSREEKLINEFLRGHNCKSTLSKGWGMCELGGTVTFSYAKSSNSSDVGIPLPLVTVSAFDQENNLELRAGHCGELRVLSPSRMKEYYMNPSATADFFHTDDYDCQWGCTGDIGYVDEDGFVFVLGRASDCFCAPDGGKVYLFDIENILLRDEAVSMCKVVDMELDSKTVPIAHIVLSESSKENIEATVRRLDALCREVLAEYAVPVAYKFREDFPVKPSGKRDAEALRNEREGYINAAGEPVTL